MRLNPDARPPQHTPFGIATRMNAGTHTTVTPFRLPLAEGEFRAALQRGQGRALMHVRSHGAFGLKPFLLDACLHNQAYDAQCEGDRAAWMLEIIDAAGIQDSLAPRLLEGFAAGRAGGFWDQLQRARLALLLARRGLPAFRTALYGMFCKSDSSADLVAAEEIIQLDGADGLHFVAEQIGHWSADNPDIHGDDTPLKFFNEIHGDGTAERILRAAARQNVHVAAYLKRLANRRSPQGPETPFKLELGSKRVELWRRFGSAERSPTHRSRDRSADEIIHEILTTDPTANRHRLAYRTWGKRAPEDELRKVAAAMFAEPDERRLYLFLHVFVRCGLPEMNGRMLALAESDNADIRALAVQVLAHHEDPAVRRLALDRIRAGRVIESELGLFVKNFRPGDWQTIARTLRLPQDQEALHDVLSELLDVFKANAVEEAVVPLLLVYERMPCGICRRSAVKSLRAMERLPDWVREECRFDADTDTRRLVAPSDGAA